MSLAEKTARGRRMVACAEDAWDTTQRLLLRDPDLHIGIELLSYALFRCAEGLAIAGATFEEILEIARRGHDFAQIKPRSFRT